MSMRTHLHSLAQPPRLIIRAFDVLVCFVCLDVGCRFAEPEQMGEVSPRRQAPQRNMDGKVISKVSQSDFEVGVSHEHGSGNDGIRNGGPAASRNFTE